MNILLSSLPHRRLVLDSLVITNYCSSNALGGIFSNLCQGQRAFSMRCASSSLRQRRTLTRQAVQPLGRMQEPVSEHLYKGTVSFSSQASILAKVNRTAGLANKRLIDQLERRPLVSNLVLGAGLAAIGDVICQLIVEGKSVKQFSFSRFLGMVSFCGFYAATFSRLIFGLYPRILPASIVNVPWKEGIVSSMLDNFIHSPLLYLPTFYVWTGAFASKTVYESMNRYVEDGTQTMYALLAVWLPAQAVNFSVVPRSQRVLFVCCANLVWNVILDVMHHVNE